jgi:hypothetical protein
MTIYALLSYYRGTLHCKYNAVRLFLWIALHYIFTVRKSIKVKQSTHPVSLKNSPVFSDSLQLLYHPWWMNKNNKYRKQSCSLNSSVINLKSHRETINLLLTPSPYTTHTLHSAVATDTAAMAANVKFVTTYKTRQLHFNL